MQIDCQVFLFTSLMQVVSTASLKLANRTLAVFTLGTDNLPGQTYMFHV